MFIVDEKRIATMRARLGDASDLVDDDRFLPMFRNRQKQHPEEFEESIKIAKTKKLPSRYFASVWGKKNLMQSLKWLREKINRVKNRLIEKAHLDLIRKREAQIEKDINPVGRAKLEQMIDYNRFSLRR